MSGWISRLLGAALLAGSAIGAMCHGMLVEPRSRNVVAKSNYCPHCLNAGGPGETYAGGRRWPDALHGVCGDAASGRRDHEAGGKFAGGAVTAEYAEGQTVTLRVKITTAHGGRFSFGICPLPDDAIERDTVTQACFDAHPLTRAGHDDERYWWLGTRGEGDYSMDFVLPRGVRCSRCVLQWHYESGNSCTIPGTPRKHVVSPGMEPCDRVGVMEEFWNCADVSITPRAAKRSLKCAPRGPPPCQPR